MKQGGGGAHIFFKGYKMKKILWYQQRNLHGKNCMLSQKHLNSSFCSNIVLLTLLHNVVCQWLYLGDSLSIVMLALAQYCSHFISSFYIVSCESFLGNLLFIALLSTDSDAKSSEIVDAVGHLCQTYRNTTSKQLKSLLQTEDLEG